MFDMQILDFLVLFMLVYVQWGLARSPEASTVS